MSGPWHDINAPGLKQRPKKPESNKPAVTDDAPPPPKKPLVKLSDGKFIPPDEGAAINKKCPVQVSVEYLDDSAKSMKKVTFSLYSTYNGQTNNLSHYADGYEKDGIAQADLILYPPPGYQEGDNVDYFFKAEHIRGEKVIDSEDIMLPQETTTIVLQKSHYDENGAAVYDKPQSGENFKPNNVVKKLQGDLIKTAFLPEGSDDGFFGDQTDKAVNDFQDYAIKSMRMKRSVGKTENTDTTLDQQAPDGIVGKKTRDELDKWLQNSWVKPIPTLRHGEYDDTGVQNGKGQRGTDDHHQGTPVVEAQQNLQKVGVYSDGAIDGWFYDKMLCGVNIFQSAAADATFSVDGKTTQFDDKLTGYQKGEMCLKTQEYLKMVVDKGGVVPKDVKIEYDGDIAKIPDKAKTILIKILNEVGISSVKITSTTRTPADQARIMYDNLQQYGVQKQKQLYGENGDLVIDEYEKAKNEGKQESEIKQKMESKIKELGPATVSKHCGDPSKISIFDIAPSSIPDTKKSDFVKALKNSKDLSKYLLPPTDPAYHLEIVL